MQKRRKPVNWLVAILFAILTFLTVWSVDILIKNRFPVEGLKNQVNPTQSHFFDLNETKPEQNVLKVAGDDSNPPYSFLQDGQALGLDNDIMREIAKNLGMEVEFKLSSLPEALIELQKGNADVISGMPFSETDHEGLLFGSAHAVISYDLFVRRNSEIQSMQDLSDKRLVLLNRDDLEKYLSTNGYSGEIIVAEYPLEALSWLASGIYDGAILSRMQGYFLIKKHLLGNIKGLSENIGQTDYGFAVSQDNQDLLIKINQERAVLNATGTYEELVTKWLSTYQQASYFDRNEFLIYGLVILFTSVFIVVLWGWSLSRLVKRRTAELKASEKKYRQLVNSANEGVVIIIDKLLVYLNPQAASILGYEVDIPKGKISLLDHIHPLDHELVLIKYHQLMENLLVNTNLTFRVITTTGAIKWIRSSTVKIDWDDKPALLAFFSDITEERKLQDSIKTSEERYRLVFDQSPVGLFYYDTDLKITNVNEQFASIMNVPRTQLQGFNLNSIKDTRIINALKGVFKQKDGSFEGRITPFLTDGVKSLYIKLQTTPLLNEKMESNGGIGLLVDLTEQIKNEHKIKNLEDKFAKTFYTSPDSINITTVKDGRIIDINRGFTELTGYTREEAIGKTAPELNLWVDPEKREIMLKMLESEGECKNLEADFKYKDGQAHCGLISASVIEIEGEACVLSIVRDINEYKKSEQMIRESELRYRSIFETVPVSIWEQDYSGVYDLLEELRNKGVTDLSDYLDTHVNFMVEAMKSIKTIDVNEASLKIYQAGSKEQLYVSLDRIFNEESFDNFKEELKAIWNHETIFIGDSVNLDLNGKRLLVNVVMKIPNTREEFRNLLVSITDITQRKLAEEALLESESRYRQLVEQINVVVYLEYAGVPSRTKYVSPQIESLLGYTQEEWLTDPDLMVRVVHPDDTQAFMDADKESDITGKPFIIEYRAFKRNGEMIWIHDEAVLALGANGNPDDWHGVMYDITEKKMAEEALRESEVRYRTIFNSVPVSIKEEDFTVVFEMLEDLRSHGVTNLEDYMASHPDWIQKAVKSIRIVEVNDETLRIYKAESREQLLSPLDAYFLDESYASFRNELLAFWNHQTVYEQETINTTLSGEKINVWVSITLPPQTENYSRVLVTIMDITERKKAEEQIRVQLRYLAALRAVDMAISASMDLPITLRVLLNQVHQQLMTDAVSVLILDPHTQSLRYAAGIGFKTNAIENTNLRLGQSYAGQVALERRVITVSNLDSKSSWLQTKDFEQEGFSHYLGVPLISKGTVKGVLELFNHNEIEKDPAWMGLLESMAGQAAIAIENATLMDEVQKININLRSAYDATIEGWARSVDLRNGDSEFHAKRVAELTIELAQTAGMQGEGLLNLRHGALLHDIGKLAIPDSILKKPGPLTDKEWEIMKTHTVIARQLLTSIEFLQSSIEIPYYHHERWDGTGYPEGLKGTAIPLAARIFAVVDCWDSLRSDRPWRKAWTDGNAWDYIEGQIGKAFDPQIVEKFRQLLGHGFSNYF